MRRFTSEAELGGLCRLRGDAPYRVGDLSIFFRGYIFNVDDFCRAAKEEPMNDETRYAQCFAKAYERWGESLSRYVFGEFAVAIYDSFKRILVLAHDTLGIVPMYYQEQSDRLLFASHIEGLLNRGCPRQLDEEYIADYLCYGDHYGTRTPFSAIKRLAIGTSVSYSAGKLREHDCWALRNSERIRYADTRDYADHCRTLIEAAVEATIPNRGTTWCELSGGLDSSTVLCVAAKTSKPTKLGSISYVYPESGRSDESVWIQAVNQHTGVRSHFVNADAVRAFSELPAYFCAQPSHAMINAALHRSCDQVFVENNVDVLLTGMGGDAVLFGDGPEPFFLADLLCQGHFISFTRVIKGWINRSAERRPARYWISRCAVTAIIRRLRNHLIQDHPPKIPWIETNYPGALKRNGKRRGTWVPHQTSVADSWFMERVLRSANVVSGWDFTSTMRPEVRHPLMYLPLVQFMRSIPWEVKLSPASDRPLHRAAFANILPALISQRQTKGGPDQAIYNGLEAGVEWLRVLTNQTKLSTRGYIDNGQWIRAVELARLGRCESIKHFKATATLEVWLQQLEVAAS